MDTELIAWLMKPASERKPKVTKEVDYSKGFAFVRDDAGIVTKMPITPEVKAAIGRYEGRAGTMRRSRKGRTSRMPNGRRFYNNVAEMEVVSYLIKP